MSSFKSRMRALYGARAAALQLVLFGISFVVQAAPSGAALHLSQSPELARLVTTGTLAPLEQRLPQHPEVVTPHSRIGTYGGTLRTALRSSADQNAILRMVGAQGLVRWTPDFSAVVPNLAERWTRNADATEYTFYLRQGTRWSDGAPFTAEDVLFAVNDLVTNPQFFTITPSRYVIQDKPMVAERIDDYTVKIRFAGSYRRFPEELATPLGQHPVMYPKHYCGRFHPKHNPAIGELLKGEHVQDWPTLMRIKCGDIEVATRWSNPEKPTLDPWLVKEPYNGSSTRVFMTRNPYFWQVDTRGQQLPYIDNLQFQVISDPETILLAALNGQLDFQYRHIGGVFNRAVLAESARRSAYTLFELPEMPSNIAGLYLNYTTKNPALRELFRNRDFRVALSLAMDRKFINEMVLLGQGEPWQIGPIRESRFYDARLATQFLEHDPARANAILDRLGFSNRDSEGFRLFPNGKRLEFNVSVVIGSLGIDVARLLHKQFKAVGIGFILRPVERALHYDRARTNDYDAAMDSVAGGLDPTLDMRSIVSIHPLESRQSLLWVRWYESNGKAGEEPPPNMKQRLALYDKWQSTKTDKEADALFREILRLAADEFDVIGTVRPAGATALRNSRLMNVPASFPSGWSFGSPGPTLPQQYFFAR